MTSFLGSPFTSILKRISPYTTEELENIRFEMLELMYRKSFDHYLSQVRSIVEKCSRVILSHKDLMNDECFAELRGQVWWQEEAPFLKRKFDSLSLGPLEFDARKSAIGATLDLILQDFLVDLFVGVPADVPKQQILLFTDIIKTYFHESKTLWPIMLNMDYWLRKSSFEASNAKADVIKIFKIAVAGSGPFILKIFQQINSSSAKLVIGATTVGELTGDVLSNVPELSTREVEFIRDHLDVSNDLKQHFKVEAMASGSLAQTHCSYLNTTKLVLNNQNQGCAQNEKYPVVIKILKPAYLFFYLCEMHMLLTTTWKQLGKHGEPAYTKQARQLLLFFVREFSHEFDYVREAAFTRQAFQIYNLPSHHIRVVQLVEEKVNPFPCLVLEVGSQVALTRVLDQLSALPANEAKKTVIKKLHKPIAKLLETWIVNLFWGTGYFHADLHAGNILVPSLDRLLASDEPVDIWVIDFGSSGQLTPKMQCALIDTLMLPARIRNLSHLVPADTFHELETKENVLPTNLSRYFHEFDSLSVFQKLQLNKATADDKLIPVHEANLRIVKAYVRLLWRVCNIKSQNNDEIDSVAKKMLNYSSKNDFGSLFLGFVKFSSEVGECTSNQTLLFGRAISYVSQVIFVLEEMCDDPVACPPWTLVSAVRQALIRHPLQIARFIAGYHTCAS
jgi:predicted unusual protein kinase regulating ubiquinone biosynthesis (AarF/ABC1/UbiB family)